MRQLRAGLLILFLAVITPPFALISILTCWLPAKWRYHTIGQWNRSVVWAMRVFCGVRHQVIGAENLPSTPCVICSKHQSAWETLAYYTILPPCSFVIKRSLLLIPFFGWGLHLSMAPIPINRGSPQAALRSVLRTGLRRLQTGFCVVVFPEGTRIPVGENRAFLPSAATLASQAKVPMVPVALNSGRCWPPGGVLGFRLQPGEVTVSIGPPLVASGRKSRAVLAEARSWINAETERLGG